jgi:hypothetical protein
VKIVLIFPLTSNSMPLTYFLLFLKEFPRSLRSPGRGSSRGWRSTLATSIVCWFGIRYTCECHVIMLQRTCKRRGSGGPGVGRRYRYLHSIESFPPTNSGAQCQHGRWLRARLLSRGRRVREACNCFACSASLYELCEISGLSASSSRRAVTPFKMPAMSPTMTEGGIAS